MRRAKAPTPHRRDGTWYLIRRVPKEVRHEAQGGPLLQLAQVAAGLQIVLGHDPIDVYDGSHFHGVGEGQ